MKNKISKDIDLLIEKIKSKQDGTSPLAADFFIILTLEILRVELQNNNISEMTIRACNEISSTTSHFYYYKDNLELYKQLQSTFNEIHKSDSRFYSADINSIGFTKSDWNKYLNEAITKLIEQLPNSISK
jgi:hypothetical protein